MLQLAIAVVLALAAAEPTSADPPASGPPAASNPPSAAASAATPTAAETAPLKDDSQTVVCEEVAVIGSNIPRRQCKTKAQWERLRARTQDQFRQQREGNDWTTQ